MDSSAASSLQGLRQLAPEAFLLLGACAAFATAVSRQVEARRRVAMLAALVATVGALVATLLDGAAWTTSTSPFGGLVRIDGWVQTVRLLALAGLAVTLAASWRSPELDAGRNPLLDAAPEYVGLLGTATAAASLMASAHDILTAFLAIELASLPSYLLVAFRRRSPSGAEAALKYVVYGSVASGISLFGFSWLYGAARATSFAGLGAAFTQAPLVATAAAWLVLGGLAFKLAAAPFHMWCPDAYEGAPLPVAMFLSLVPKAGALVLVGRFVGASNAPVVTWAVAGLAAVSMTWGNVAALAQTRLRRLLAYSAIAHAGTMLLAFLTPSGEAATALLVYLAAYLCMGLVAFLAVAFFSSRGAETLDDYRGLGARAPFVSLVFTVALFSLTGLPPLAGFLGKYALFAALVSAALSPETASATRALLLGLVTLGVLNTVVALAYYARVVKALYFDAPVAGPRVISLVPSASATPRGGRFLAPAGSWATRGLMVLLTAGTLALGLAPGRFLAWADGWVPSCGPLVVSAGASVDASSPLREGGGPR